MSCGISEKKTGIDLPISAESRKHSSQSNIKPFLCVSLLETPEHALLECETDQGLSTLRRKFYDQLETISPAWFYDWMTVPSPLTERLKKVIAKRDMVAAVARFAYHVLALYDEHPLFTLV
jgi:hypothetical protein